MAEPILALLACLVIVAWWVSLWLALRIGGWIVTTGFKKQVWALMGAAENMAAGREARNGR